MRIKRDGVAYWWVWAASLVPLLVGGAVFVIAPAVAAQPQDVLNERARLAIETLTRDVETIQQIQAEARLRLLEADMTEVKWLGRTVAAALIGQLVLAGLAKREAMRERSGRRSEAADV